MIEHVYAEQMMAKPQNGLTESQARTILENVQDALIATDSDGFVLYMNDAAAHLYGFGERVGVELESFNLRRYALDTFEVRTLAGDSVPEDDQPLARVLRGDAYQNVELLVRHRELDETRVFVFSGCAVDADPPIGVLTIRDETDRWQAERRYRTAFETDPAPSLIARLEDEQIVQANVGMQEMLDSDKSDIVGKTLTELELLSQDDTLPKSLDMLRAGERIHKHKTTLQPPTGGEPMNVLVSARAIEIDDAPCGIFTFSDLTELERTEQENRTKAEMSRARSRLTELRESERASIARDLHDDVVQDLLALSMELGNERRAYVQDGNIDAAEVSRRSRERALHAVAQLRRAVRGLRPAALRELGLWLSLREALPDLHAPDDPTVSFPAGMGPDLPEETLVVLHRVAQEAIRNALKHANATKVQVTFHTTETEAIMQVQDDGRGFEVPERISILERHDHFGLISMEERIEALDGTLEIDSTTGVGTTIRCRVPLGS